MHSLEVPLLLGLCLPYTHETGILRLTRGFFSSPSSNLGTVMVPSRPNVGKFPKLLSDSVSLWSSGWLWNGLMPSCGAGLFLCLSPSSRLPLTYSK
jgi:hypothetical protein